MSGSEKIHNRIDYSLLFFIIGVTYVKLYVKIAAILFFAAYLLYKKYKPAKLTSLHKFYLLMPVAGTIGSLIHGSFNQTGYWFGWSFGIMYWMLAAATAYMIYIAVLNTHAATLHKTLKAFFTLNFLASILQLLYLVKLSGHPVPYWYWDASEYFGSSTGDHIYGIFGNVSVTNAMISTLGAFYFLYKRDLKWSVMCILSMLLCTSNLTIALFLALSVCIFILVRQKKVRLNILALLLTTLIIYPILSPQNVRYVDSVYVHETTQGPTQIVIADKLKVKSWVAEGDKNELERAFSTLNASLTSKINYYRLPLNDNKAYNHIDELKYIELFGKLENKDENVAELDTNALKNLITDWYGIPYSSTPLTTYKKPVKLYSNIQTLFFLYDSPLKNFFGAGIGNFSSKQALKMLGLNVQGSYPAKYTYVSEDFIRYHLYTFFYVFSLPISEHSIINMINSVYNQVGGEYGIAGILLFLFLYIGFFWKNRKKITAFGFTILPLTLLFFNFDYWFEMLSLTVFLELFMFIDIYKKVDNEQQ